VARPDKGVASVANVRHAHPVGLGVPPRIPFATIAEIRSCTLFKHKSPRHVDGGFFAFAVQPDRLVGGSSQLRFGAFGGSRFHGSFDGGGAGVGGGFSSHVSGLSGAFCGDGRIISGWVARPDKGVASVANVRHAHPVGLSVPPRIPFATIAEIRSCTLFKHKSPRQVDGGFFAFAVQPDRLVGGSSQLRFGAFGGSCFHGSFDGGGAGVGRGFSSLTGGLGGALCGDGRVISRFDRRFGSFIGRAHWSGRIARGAPDNPSAQTGDAQQAYDLLHRLNS